MTENRQLLNTYGYSYIYKKLFTFLGSTPTILLCDLIDKDDAISASNTDHKGWFYKSQKYILYDTSIRKQKQRRAFKALEENRVIDTRYKGIPRKKEFKINYKLIKDMMSIELNNTIIDKFYEVFSNPTINVRLNHLLYNINSFINTYYINNISINTNIEEVSKKETPVKSKYYLSSKHYAKYIPLFHEWNTYSNLSNMKLPETKESNCTKALKEICTLLDQLQEGTFFKKQIISNESYDNTKVYSLIDIKKAFSYLNQSHEAGWFRSDKKGIPKSLKDYLVTYKHQFSFFVKFMENPPKQINTVKQPQTPVKSSLIDQYINAVGVSDNKGRKGVENQLKRLQREYEEIEKNIGLLYNKWKTGYTTHLSNFTLFAETHLNHLKESYGDQLTVGHLACYPDKEGNIRPVWKRFIEFIKETYGVNLYPHDKGLLKMKRWHYLGKTGKYKVDDFRDMYLEEEWKLIDEGRYLK